MHKIIPEVILASQSVSRKLLLERLMIPFQAIPAHIDESQLPDELPMQLVERLSKEKALKISKNLPPKKPVIIIGSDQVAVHDNKIYGKPGNFEKAFEQLSLFNNSTIEFITGLYVTNLTDHYYIHEISKIKLKKLTDQQIKNYLNKDQPFECAASFKIEGCGISLVDNIQTDDFNAIIGLPIIKLIKILDLLGFNILDYCLL
ncbi:MAG: septum formation protein Maf [Gammaproteobacteria bacterium]|nr:septum formation protein Maf [Gammaproteobacteria bacterium]